MRALVFRTELPRLVLSMAYSRVAGFPPLFAMAPLTVRDVALPALGAGQVRVRTRLGGICGSDLHMLRVEVSRHSSVVATRRDTLGGVTFPGHEALGDVVAVGRGVRRVTEGQRVALIPGVFCSAFDDGSTCEYCREGHIALCRRRSDRPPFFVGGGWSEEFVRHESQLIAVPDAIDDETATLIEPAGCGIHAVLRKPPRDGDRVLVVGAGMIGLTIVAALRALDVPCRITVLCRHEFQAERALALGADDAVGQGAGDPYELLAATVGTRVQGRDRGNRYIVDGFDLIYDVVGSARSLHDAVRWCRPHGTVVLEGIDMFPGKLDRTQLWRRELNIVGAIGQGQDDWRGTSANTFVRVIAWLVEGRLRLDRLLTHRYPQARYREALRTAYGKHDSGAIRVALDFRPAAASSAGRAS